MARKNDGPTLGSALVFLLGAGAILWLAVFAGMYGFSIIIGEEGYVVPDELIPAGSHDPAVFHHNNITDSLCNNFVAYSFPWNYCKAHVGQDLLYVTGGDTIWLPENPIATKLYLETPDLYLKDYKMDFVVSSTHKNADGCLRSSRGGNLVCLDRDTTSSVSIELRWDDYEAGHYQLFVNDNPVEEGVTDSLTLRAYGAYFAFDGDWARVGFRNPRWRYILGCEQEGLALANTCFGGPDALTIDELEGFVRFCPDIAAVHTVGDISGESNQVYYALAAGEAVIIENAEFWEFTYLADRNFTGLVHECPGLIETTDLEDLPVQEPDIQDQTLWWTSAVNMNEGSFTRIENRLYSGDEVLFRVDPPEMRCPVGDGIVQYPGDFNADCLDFNTDQLGNFIDGQVKSASGMTGELESVTWRGLEQDGFTDYVSRARFKLTFDVSATTVDMDALEAVNLGDSQVAVVTVRNGLPGGATYRVTLESEKIALGMKEFQSQEISLSPGGVTTLAFVAPTDIVGDVRLQPTAVLLTSAGEVVMSSRPQETYNVRFKEGVPIGQGGIGDGEADLPWWTRLWLFFKNLFNKIDTFFGGG